ncbi:MAG: class I SAM-dependent methyltransferase [Hyphomicrobiales bacterium]|uniref:class I SAM-dependent methyltransferase n=1 Tax=Roseibium polysiphoniae TaxID=2571221 RepID=UPI003296BB8E
MSKSEIHEFDGYRDNYGSEINQSLAFAGKNHDFYLKLKADHLLSIISQHIDTKNTVELLDVGCGHGLMHRFLKTPGLKVNGCDPAATVVEEAKKQNSEVAYRSNDGETLPYEDNTFDVSTAVCVMHHVPPAQWLRFLSEMYRVTKSGGIVAIYEHNPYNPVTRHIVNTCPLDENAVLLTSSELKRLLKKAQFSQPKTEFIAVFPFKSGIFRFFERLLSWLPLGAQYVSYATVK